MKDPESSNLDCIQIVKGWYQAGYPREKIYDVAWSDGRTPDAKTSKFPHVGNTVIAAGTVASNSCITIGDFFIKKICFYGGKGQNWAVRHGNVGTIGKRGHLF